MAPWGREAAEQLWELRKQSCLRQSQTELRSVSKATCLFLGGKDYCSMVGPQPCAQSPPHLPGSDGEGAIPAPLGAQTSVLTTTKRNLCVTDPLAAIFPLLPLGFNHQNHGNPSSKLDMWGGVQCRERLCNRGAQESLLSSPTGLTSLLAGCSTTSNLYKDPQASAGSEPDTVKGLQTNRARSSRANEGPQGSTAASPHLQPSWKRIRLIYFTDCLQLKPPPYGDFCTVLQTIILLISIMIITCQML